MSLEKTICNSKSRHILKHGEAVWLAPFSYPNGGMWIARYKDKYFYIVHDGTGNEFYHSHAPKEITEDEAKRIASNYEEAWQEAMELWGWESLDEYFAKTI